MDDPNYAFGMVSMSYWPKQAVWPSPKSKNVSPPEDYSMSMDIQYIISLQESQIFVINISIYNNSRQRDTDVMCTYTNNQIDTYSCKSKEQVQKWILTINNKVRSMIKQSCISKLLKETRTNNSRNRRGPHTSKQKVGVAP